MTTLLARKAAVLVAQALVAAALTVRERGKLHTAVMLLSDALNVLDEGDDRE